MSIKAGRTQTAGRVIITSTREGRRPGPRLQAGNDPLPFDGSADRQIHRVLQARGILGLIICPPEGKELSLAFDLTGYSSVVIGNALKTPSLHRLIHNHEGGMEICILELIRRGYRRIGLALHDRADVNTH